MSNEEEKIHEVPCFDKKLKYTEEEYQQYQRDFAAGEIKDYLGIDDKIPDSDLNKIVDWKNQGKPLDKTLSLETKGLEAELKDMEKFNREVDKENQQFLANFDAIVARNKELSKGNE